jgi:hypothetical protein
MHDDLRGIVFAASSLPIHRAKQKTTHIFLGLSPFDAVSE